MTLDDIKRLKEVCAKATQGEWCWVDADHSRQQLGLLFSGGKMVLDGPEFIFGEPGDARYIATFSPQQVAELLELAEKALKWLPGITGETPNEP